MKKQLTSEAVREVLDYAPDTGIFTWKVTRGGTARAGSVAGTFNHGGYVQINVLGQLHTAHRLAWLYMTGVWPTQHIDHLDGNRQNNRFANLRDVQQQLNNQNQRRATRRSSTGLLGAYRTAHGTFTAHIGLNGRVRCLGTYATPEEAHEAYITAKRELHDGSTL